MTAVTGLLYTIPSLAAFALLVPVFGFSMLVGVRPAHDLHAADPVPEHRRRVPGRPADVLEAAEGMGYTRRQRLLRVEIPLAMPMMITGMRLATVTVIGLATVASIIGATLRRASAS